MEFEAWLEQKGFDLATMSEGQISFMRGVWRSEMAGPKLDADGNNPGSKKADEATAELDEIAAKKRAKVAREKRITEIVGAAIEEYPSRLDDLQAVGRAAIRNDWDELRTELEVHRTCRSVPPPPFRSSGNAPAVSEKVIEAALATAMGIRGEDSGYDSQTLEIAHKAFRGGMGLHQLLHLAATANGYRGTASVRSNLHEVLRYAFTPNLRASSTSTISVSGILSNVANKMVRVAFLGVDSAWSRIVARKPVTDFKQITSYSLTGDLTYEEIPAGGQIKHGSLDETSYTNQAKSYGKFLALDRRDMINDDLNAFSAINTRLGRGGALKLNRVIWAEFLDNSSFFSSGNSNVSTGAGSALSIAGLDAAHVVFKTQTDPNGELFGAKAAILLVPTALGTTATTLMANTTVVASTTANVPIPNGNRFAGMFEPVETPYLQDSSLTGYSNAAWYLLADPADVPVIEVCFLNGVEMPTVESADADFDTLGISFRGYFDFGASKQEYRGGVRSAGS